MQLRNISHQLAFFNIKFHDHSGTEIRDNLDTMSDNEALAIIERFKKAEDQMHNLKTEFSSKLSKIIQTAL